MNIKKILALLSLPAVLMLSVSCSADNEESVVLPDETVQPSEIQSSDEENKSIEKPVLKIEEVEISYSELDHENGTVVPVDYSVSGIVDGWSGSGVHIAFDKRLDLKINDINKEPSFKTGDASENLSSVLVIRWKGENPPEELAGKDMDNIAVITADSANKGLNGVIASVDFMVPADAKAGDIYEIEFFKYKTDCFTNSEQNKEMQDFAFGNWQNGYIKITD